MIPNVSSLLEKNPQIFYELRHCYVKSYLPDIKWIVRFVFQNVLVIYKNMSHHAKYRKFLYSAPPPPPARTVGSQGVPESSSKMISIWLPGSKGHKIQSIRFPLRISALKSSVQGTLANRGGGGVGLYIWQKNWAGRHCPLLLFLPFHILQQIKPIYPFMIYLKPGKGTPFGRSLPV